MDPFTASVLVGLFANGLYSLIISTRDKVGDLAFREEDIHKRLIYISTPPLKIKHNLFFYNIDYTHLPQKSTKIPPIFPTWQ